MHAPGLHRTDPCSSSLAPISHALECAVEPVLTDRAPKVPIPKNEIDLVWHKSLQKMSNYFLRLERRLHDIRWYSREMLPFPFVKLLSLFQSHDWNNLQPPFPVKLVRYNIK